MQTWKHKSYHLDHTGEWCLDVETNDMIVAVQSIANWQSDGHGTKIESFFVQES